MPTTETKRKIVEWSHLWAHIRRRTETCQVQSRHEHLPLHKHTHTKEYNHIYILMRSASHPLFLCTEMLPKTRRKRESRQQLREETTASNVQEGAAR